MTIKTLQFKDDGKLLPLPQSKSLIGLGLGSGPGPSKSSFQPPPKKAQPATFSSSQSPSPVTTGGAGFANALGRPPTNTYATSQPVAPLEIGTGAPGVSAEDSSDEAKAQMQKILQAIFTVIAFFVFFFLF